MSSVSLRSPWTFDSPREVPMPILCATDFLPSSLDALGVAAALAERMGQPLRLIHVSEGKHSVLADPRDAAAQDRLEQLAAELRSRNVAVEAAVLEGVPDEAILEDAARSSASLLVVGALGRRSRARWRLGSVAERIVRQAGMPVLVVRRPQALREWVRGERTLQVTVGDDLGPSSEAALRLCAAWSRHGATEFMVVHAYGMLEEMGRLGLYGSRPDPRLQLDAAKLAALERHAGPLLQGATVRYRVAGGFGRPADSVLGVALDAAADLVVVGTRQERGLLRAWHGSMSDIVVHDAVCNVLCVPAAPTSAGAAVIPRLSRVLATTDFSPLANRAIPLAYAMLPSGGTLHLLHVAEADASPQEGDPSERLRGLVPEDAVARGIETRIELAAGDNVAAAIAQVAERLDVDAVVLATHGRSGLSRLRHGSVAQEVLRRCVRPLLLVPPPP